MSVTKIREEGSEQMYPLEAQQVEGVYLDVRYEVWHDGVFLRKTQVASAAEGANCRPDIVVDCPPQCLKRLIRITNAPVYLSSVGTQLDNGQILIGVTFATIATDADPEAIAAVPSWETVWLTAEQAADEAKLLTFARYGLPVRSSNKRLLSDYLTDCFRAATTTGIEHKAIIERCSYHERGSVSGWLVGKQWIGDGSATAHPHQYPLCAGFTSAGTIEEWSAFVEEAWSATPQSWIIRWLLGVSFAAPLLRFINERTFFVHQYSKSGGGKTVLGMLGQSVWGHPKQLMLALNQITQTSLTEIFKYISDLPVLLDEVQGSSIGISDFIMQACTEKHKVRTKQTGGLVDPTAGEHSWRTIIRTTGEQTLSGADKNDLGGQANRVVEVRHPGLTTEQGMHVYRWIENAKHYGTAGPAFLEILHHSVKEPSRLEQLRSSFARFIEQFAKENGRDAPMAIDRQLAAIALGEAMMFKYVFGMDNQQAGALAMRDGVDISKSHLRVRGGHIPLALQAVEFILEHRYSRAQLWVDALSEEGRLTLKQYGARSGGALFGVFNAGENADEVWIMPKGLEGELRRLFNAPPQRAIEELAQEGFIIAGTDRIARQRQIRGVFNSRAYVFSQARLLQIFQRGNTEPQVTETEGLFYVEDTEDAGD